ncbi:peptidylprolyl isomerase [Sphingomonas naphthae]|uniref:peptidylprolyl isomerase n=1 Tax=Sphingomonas naphthae TaxID=1813468 RepID=A0ABY7TL69_9SPHN|nr:peptidylprolyl isomerase [Sphingomonas naphthae]WCT73716.1 peptidylprolyl isomerase [Sphingomonas naphthae]
MVRTFALVLALLAAPLAAQTPVVPPPAPPMLGVAPAPRPATVKVTLATSEGPIVLELESERAPITTGNFLKYVDQKRLDGTSFYRATMVAKEPLFGLIQGGVKFDPKKVLPPIKHEPTTVTGLGHTDGTISMARGAPGTATADFFITIGDMPSMNADPKAPGDNQGFAAFGHVVEGMDIVRRILTAPTSPTAGVGPMKGQMLAAPVKIETAKRVK